MEKKSSVTLENNNENTLWEHVFRVFLDSGDVYMYDAKEAIKKLKEMGFKIIKENPEQ